MLAHQLTGLLILGTTILAVVGCSDADVKLSSIDGLAKVTKVDSGVTNPLDESTQSEGGAFRFSGSCRTQVTGFKVQLGDKSEILIPSAANSYPDFSTTSFVINKNNIAANSVTGSTSSPTPNTFEGEYFPNAVPLTFDLDCSDGHFDFYLFKSTMEWLYHNTSDFPSGIENKPSKVTITPVATGLVTDPVVFNAPNPSQMKLDFESSRKDPILAQDTHFVADQDCHAFNEHGCVIFKLQLQSAAGLEMKANRDYSFDFMVKNSSNQTVNMGGNYFQILPSTSDSGYGAIRTGYKDLQITLKTALAAGSLAPNDTYKLFVIDRSGSLPTAVKEFSVQSGNSAQVINTNLDSYYRMPLAKGLYYRSELIVRDIENNSMSLLSPATYLTTNVYATNLGSANIDWMFGSLGAYLLPIAPNGGPNLSYNLPMFQNNYFLLKMSDASSGQSQKISFDIKSPGLIGSSTFDWSKWPSFDIKGVSTYSSTFGDADAAYWYADHNNAYQTSGHPIIYNVSEAFPSNLMAMSHVKPEPTPSQSGRCYELRIARGTQDDAILYTNKQVTGLNPSQKNMSSVSMTITAAKYLGASNWSSPSDSGIKFFTSQSSCQNWDDNSTGQYYSIVPLNSASQGAYYKEVWVRYDYPLAGGFPVGGKIKITVRDNADSSKYKDYILNLKSGG